MHLLHRILSGLTLFVAATGAFAAPIQPAVQRVIEPFDYRGVSLDGGLLRAQLDDVRTFYAGLSDDSLLKGFRKRAGLPAPGDDLGGWYRDDVFHVFGQIVSGYSRLYAATGEARFRDKADRLVAEWAKCIAPDGYFFFSEHPNARHYIYDKMLWGLLDNYQYCGNTNALAHLSRITDWAIKNLERSRKVNDTSTEWYTLSENLYRAWLLTGDTKYRDFARVWEYPAYWDLYARRNDIFATRPDGSKSDVYHAYSHVNTLGGCGAAFLVTGDPRYLATLTNAYDYFQREQVFATGGFGPDEQLLPTAARCAKLDSTHNTFETQCSSWAVFKMGKYLLSLTGNARYGDWIEQLAINGLGASIPMSADGRVFYYADYNLHGARKRNVGIQWSCCTGTRPQAVADLADLVWLKDAQNLYVNLYAAATVRWPRPAGTVTVRQQTDFPFSDTVRFEVSLAAPEKFGLKFRVPGWLAAPMEAKVNGQTTKLALDSRHWAGITRAWKNGDRVELTLPSQLRVVPVAADRAVPAAVCFGPTTLAFQSPSVEPLRRLVLVGLKTNLAPVAGKPLRLRLISDPTVEVKPLFALREGERYFVYLSPDIGSRIWHEDLRYSGRWHESGNWHYSNDPGATAEADFEGTGVRWIGWKFDDAGHAEVSIDGRSVAVVDQFGPGRDLPFDWSVRNLAPGRHTIRLTVREDRNSQSKDRFINAGGFEILEAKP